MHPDHIPILTALKIFLALVISDDSVRHQMTKMNISELINAPHGNFLALNSIPQAAQKRNLTTATNSFYCVEGNFGYNYVWWPNL